MQGFLYPETLHHNYNTHTDMSNVIEITTNDIFDVIQRSALAGNRKPPIFLGPYGLGKSHSAAAFAAHDNREYIDFRLSYYTFNDVRGFGVPNRDKGVMEFLPTEDFPTNPDGRYLFHWEELTNCHPTTQKVAMQGILDRRVGNYHFPKDTIMMASGNRLGERTYVERLAAALADRLAFYHVRPDLDSFLGHMETHAQSDYVYAYVQANPEAPYSYDISKWDGESNLPTFRSLDRLDELVASYATADEIISDRLFAAHAASCIGPQRGREFAEFIKLTATVGNVADMLKDPLHCNLPQRTDLAWLVACKLISLADVTNFGAVLTISHRLTDPHMREPNDLQAMESYVGNAVRRRKPEVAKSRDGIAWLVKHGATLSRV